MRQESFRCATLEEVRQKALEAGAELPLSQKVELLAQPLKVCGRTLPNRLVIQPMEGCDGTAEGAPGELTRRRYRRFAQSGAGLLWLEAVAVVPEGRANPRQLMLTEKTLPAFQAMLEEIQELSLRENGFAPLLVMQATHSGRYSKPHGVPEPLVPGHSPLFEGEHPLEEDQILSDDALKALEERYAASARLAQRAGFDGVDVKACHRYLISESLSAFQRPGPYGGSLENRTRLFCNAVDAARSALTGSCFVTSRLNVYDGYPSPWGFGADETGAPVLEEPILLARRLREEYGLDLLDLTIGNPYSNPHVNRPFDAGPYEPPESPLIGVARMCDCIGQIKQAVPELKIISSGNSYLRSFGANQAAGMLERGCCDLAGFGRQAFAYPDFANDLLKTGAMNPAKCCLACSKCTELMRAGSTAGCVVRDAEVYAPIYRRDVLGK